MTQLSKALPTTSLGFSSALSLLSLDFNEPMTYSVDEATGAAGTVYQVWGSVDTGAAGTDPNILNLGEFVSPAGMLLPPDFADNIAGWPCLLIEAPAAGGAAGTFYVNGTAAEATSTLASVTTPTGVLFSALIDLTAYGTTGTRLAGGKEQKSSDVFDVFVFEDPNIVPTVTGSAGCFYLGRIQGGGGGVSPMSIRTKGWPYATVQRVSGSTVGTIKAAGVIPATNVGSVAWLLTGNTSGAANILGHLDDFVLPFQTNGITRMTLLGGAATSGFLGIGITAPTAQLHVRSTAAGGTVGPLTVDGPTTASKVEIDFVCRHATSRHVILSLGGLAGGWILETDALTAGTQRIDLLDSVAGVARLIVDSAGRLALGALVPDATAILDLSQSVLYGFGLPRPTAATIAALVLPLQGLEAFDSTAAMVRVNVGTPGTPAWSRAAGGPMVVAVNTSAQTIGNNASTTVTNWTASENRGSSFAAGSGIFTAPTAGNILVIASAQISGSSSVLGQPYRISIVQNGTIVRSGEIMAQVAALSMAFAPQVSRVVQVAAGDLITIAVFQNEAGSRPLTNSAVFNTLEIVYVD